MRNRLDCGDCSVALLDKGMFRKLHLAVAAAIRFGVRVELFCCRIFTDRSLSVGDVEILNDRKISSDSGTALY